MKAEHRKELETNILADKMGKLIVGAKQGPSRGFMFYVLAGMAALIVVFFVYRWIANSGSQNAKLWYAIEDGSLESMKIAYQSGIGDNPGKVARFEIAWEYVWGNGIKKLGGNPTLALESIKEAKNIYMDLAKACEGDPVFQPEALYGLAVIEETGLIDKANRDGGVALVVEKYNAVSKASKDSAFAAAARSRVAELEDESKSREILRFYMELEERLKTFARPQFPAGFNVEDFMPKK